MHFICRLRGWWRTSQDRMWYGKSLITFHGHNYKQNKRTLICSTCGDETKL